MINYIKRLPPGCQLDVEQRGEAAHWTLGDHLLRANANAVIAGNYQRAGKRPPAGAFIPEPGRAAPQRATGRDEPPKGADELNAMFDEREGRS